MDLGSTRQMAYRTEWEEGKRLIEDRLPGDCHEKEGTGRLIRDAEDWLEGQPPWRHAAS